MEPKQSLSVESQENPKSTAGAWLFCILYCGFAFTMFYFAVKEWREVVPILITGFFAAFGVVYIAVTIRQTIGQSKFGTVSFLMERPAPAIGGVLKGSVTLPASALQAKTVIAQLMCTKEVLDINAKGILREPVWAAKKSFPIRVKPGGASAAIAIDIPANLEASKPRPATYSMKSGDPPRTYWSYSLQVTADLPGVDLDRNYPITVLAAQPGAVNSGTEPELREFGLRPQTPGLGPQTPKIHDAPLAPLAMDLGSTAGTVAALKKAIEVPAPAAMQTPGEVERRDGSSIWVLVAANLVAIAGAAFWGWRVQDIIFLYWMENLVIGAFNLPRILLAQPDLSAAAARGLEPTPLTLLAGKAMFAAFFVVHYGAFCFGHGEFLVSMFIDGQERHGLLAAMAGVVREKGMLVALLAIFASHAYSFFRNYVGRREYEGVNFAELMFRPYKRIFVTHIFIIAGGFLLFIFKLPLAALVLFIAIKIGADAYFHRRERAALAQESK